MWYEIDPLIVVKISRFLKVINGMIPVLHSTANIKKVRFQESGFEIQYQSKGCSFSKIP